MTSSEVLLDRLLKRNDINLTIKDKSYIVSRYNKSLIYFTAVLEETAKPSHLQHAREYLASGGRDMIQFTNILKGEYDNK